MLLWKQCCCGCFSRLCGNLRPHQLPVQEKNYIVKSLTGFSNKEVGVKKEKKREKKKNPQNIQQNTVSSNQCNKMKEIKGISIRKEEIKLSLLSYDIIVYVVSPRNLQKSLGTNYWIQQGCRILKATYKNRLFFYVEAMNMWILKLKYNTICNCLQKSLVYISQYCYRTYVMKTTQW